MEYFSSSFVDMKDSVGNEYRYKCRGCGLMSVGAGDYICTNCYGDIVSIDHLEKLKG